MTFAARILGRNQEPPPLTSPWVTSLSAQASGGGTLSRAGFTLASPGGGRVTTFSSGVVNSQWLKEDATGGSNFDPYLLLLASDTADTKPWYIRWDRINNPATYTMTGFSITSWFLEGQWFPWRDGAIDFEKLYSADREWAGLTLSFSRDLGMSTHKSLTIQLRATL